MSELLRIKTEAEVAFVTLNRPEKRNALNPPLIKELLCFFEAPGWSSDTKAVVLSGEGKAFCSGADLKWLADSSAFSVKDLKKLFSLLQAVENCPLPVIAMVQGFAVGGGLGLLSVADVVVAEDRAFFRFSETHLGLVPSVISPFVLKKTGLSWARFLMLSARVFSAREAYERGLVHFVGTRSACALFQEKLLTDLKTLDPKALTETKKWLNRLSSLSSNRLTPDHLKEEALHLISESRKQPEVTKRIKKLLKD